MIRMSIDEVVPPMRLARSLYTADGRVLLGQNATLTRTYLERLRNFNVHSLWVWDDRLSDMLLVEIYTPETRTRLALHLSNIFSELHSDRTALRKILAGGVFDRVLLDAMESRRAPIPIPDDSPIESALISHSVRVCLLSTALGVQLSHGRDQLLNLSIGALVHDAGVESPQIHKDSDPGDRSRHHPADGFDAVLRARNLSATVGVICLQHHERLDGYGWPRGLAGEAIHPFARLVAVADRFDVLTFGKPGLLPHLAMAELREDAGRGLDPNMVELFCNSVVPYAPGTPVCLSTGEQGVVVKVEPGKLDRPLVRVMEGECGRDLDLSANPEVSIEAVQWQGSTVDKAIAA